MVAISLDTLLTICFGVSLLTCALYNFQWSAIYRSLRNFVASIPHRPRTFKYHRVLKRFCKEHDIKILYRYDGVIEKSFALARNEDGKKFIQLTFPNTLEAFTAGMHEIGHHVNPVKDLHVQNIGMGVFGTLIESTHVNIKNLLVNEIYAWIWAFRNTPMNLCVDTAVYSLSSYLTNITPSQIKSIMKLFHELNVYSGTTLFTKLAAEVKPEPIQWVHHLPHCPKHHAQKRIAEVAQA